MISKLKSLTMLDFENKIGKISVIQGRMEISDEKTI